MQLDDLIADMVDELRARPYELVFVAGGWQLRTRPRFAVRSGRRVRRASRRRRSRVDADRNFGGDGDRLSATGYPRRISRLAGKEISRDVIGRLKRLDLIDAACARRTRRALRLFTTRKFLEVFGLATLRDLPDIERLEDELQRPQSEIDLDRALGLVEDDGRVFEREMEFEGSSSKIRRMTHRNSSRRASEAPDAYERRRRPKTMNAGWRCQEDPFELRILECLFCGWTFKFVCVTNGNGLKQPLIFSAYVFGICLEALMADQRHVRLFRNGRNQAVRIPVEFELPGDRSDHRPRWRSAGDRAGAQTWIARFAQNDDADRGGFSGDR